MNPVLAKVAIVAAAAVLLTGCTGGSSTGSAKLSSSPTLTAPTGGLAGDGPPPTRSTIITTPSASLTTAANGTEVDGTCPYISNADFQEYEGDRVGRVTVLQTKPVGCRFYFANGATTIVGEVLLQNFADAKTAFNSMVLSSDAHPERQSQTIGDGAIAYRTALQGEDTWQCLVTVGTKVYTVRTRQTNTSRDAFNLAAAVVRGKT